MPHELFLTTRQKADIRNDLLTMTYELSKARISNIIQPGGCFGSWLDHLGKKSLASVAVVTAAENLPGLESNINSNAINKSERKLSTKGALTAGIRFALFVMNEDMNDIKMKKSLEDSKT